MLLLQDRRPAHARGYALEPTPPDSSPADHAAGLCEIDHPLLRTLLTEARDRRCSTPRFRQVLATAGALLAYEATRDLATQPREIDTPLEKMKGVALHRPITIVPVLRAGLALAEEMHRIVPGARTGHIGMFRDESSLQPVSYYDKLPRDVAAGPVLLIDPMLATGGSVIAAIELLKQHHCHDIRFVCLLAAPEGVERLRERHPDVPIFTAAVDRELDDRGFILPGLGDAGDRSFGTVG